MKIKSLYVYGIAILLAIAVIVITSTNDTEVNNEIINDPQATMPQDNIHISSAGHFFLPWRSQVLGSPFKSSTFWVQWNADNTD